MEGADTSPVGWGDVRQAQGLGAARWDRRPRKPRVSPRRNSALHQGLGWHVEQPPVNGRGRRRGRKATCRLLAATAADHREALPSVWETGTCEPASALQAPQVPSPPDAAAGAQLRDARGRRGLVCAAGGSAWTRSPPPASAPRGLVVVAAAEGPRGRCVPRHCPRDVLTFRGDGRELTRPPAQVGAVSRRGDASGAAGRRAASPRGAGKPKALRVFGGHLRCW